MIEFALVLPLLLVVMLGLIEIGRLLFMYSVVFTSVREGARYGSAAGYISGGTYQYQDCAGIRAAAKRVGVLANIQDSNVTVTYDRVTESGVSPLGSCPVGGTGPRLTLGNRVTVRVSINYSPIVPIPNLPSFPITSTSSRTILKNISIEGTPAAASTSLPIVSFTTASQDAIEGDTGDSNSYTVVVALNEVATENISVNFSLGGSATEGVDYILGISSPIIIPDGDIQTDFVITVIGDDISEFNETVVLTIESTVNADLGTPYIHELTIVNDDDLPVVSFTAPSQSNPENLPNVSVVAQLSDPSGMDVEVPFTVSGSATPGGDYSIGASPLVIPAGSTSGSIAISVVNDTMFEPDESVVVTMGTPINAVAGAITEHTATITDEDPPPIVSFTIASQDMPEAVGTILVTVQLKDALGNEVVAGMNTSVPFLFGGTAVHGADYTISPSPLVIPVGSSRADIVVYLEQDGVIEPDETVIIELGAPDYATLGAPSTHTLSITHQTAVFFSLASQSVQESAPGVDIEVQVVPTTTAAVSVQFTLGGTATQGSDYSALDSSPLVIPAGQSRAYLSLSISPDVLDELNETVEVRLINPTNAILGTPNRHTLTITDDDATPVITFTQSNQSVQEAVVDALAQIQLSAASGLPITVPLSLGGTATPGMDFSFSQTEVVLPAGSLGATLTVNILDDLVPELVETILLSMGQPTNGVLGTPNAHTVSIQASDQPTCDIFTGNELSFPPDGQSVEWAVSNLMTDTLYLKQLTISWPTGMPNAPKFDKVFFDANQIFDGNEPHSPSTVTWNTYDPTRQLNSALSTILTTFTRVLDPGTYRLTLVFYNLTRDLECSPITRSRVRQ